MENNDSTDVEEKDIRFGSNIVNVNDNYNVKVNKEYKLKRLREFDTNWKPVMIHKKISMWKTEDSRSFFLRIVNYFPFFFIFSYFFFISKKHCKTMPIFII